MRKNIYVLSGLGADERVFENLDFGDFEPQFIRWIPPLENEKMRDYALRLCSQIRDKKPIVLGVSFGGMLAVEIAQFIDCERVIIISSAKSRKEIPLLYRIFGRTNLLKFIPISFFKQANFMTFWFFGMRTKDEKTLLKSILKDTDNSFLKWAMNAIMTWEKAENFTQNLTHIHGEKDRILPLKKSIKVDFRIPDGDHLMVYNKARKIADILHDLFFAADER